VLYLYYGAAMSTRMRSIPKHLTSILDVNEVIKIPSHGGISIINNVRLSSVQNVSITQDRQQALVDTLLVLEQSLQILVSIYAFYLTNSVNIKFLHLLWCYCKYGNKDTAIHNNIYIIKSCLCYLVRSALQFIGH
jgi:hypothetical protein